MPLEHKVAQLISQWLGLDAHERADRSDELVRDLILLIRAEPTPPRDSGAPATPDPALAI